MESVSLICTVRDEADNIAALLDSMLAQVRAADEIIINDCGSRDETASIVQDYANRHACIKLVQGGHNISSGRNNAIASAQGPLIACTDAGLTLDALWLMRIVEPLEDGKADLVGGFFTPAPHSLFELALGATNYRHADEVDPQHFLPFGNSMAFRKEMWVYLGGFPEWASHCEDLLFDRAALQAGYRRAFVPDALVHFRPRSSLQDFARQYFLYARGDGAAGLWPLRHAIRYGTYATLLLLVLAAWRYPPTRWMIALIVLFGAGAYTRGPYRRLWTKMGMLTWGERAYILALVPIIRVVGDGAKMAGYPVGLLRTSIKGVE